MALSTTSLPSYPASPSCSSSPAIRASNTRASRSTSARWDASLGCAMCWKAACGEGGDHIRISAQLIDAATGTHRWAERYDRTLEGIFAVQDEVVGTIVAILAAHVRMSETERTRAKPPGSWQAYDYYLKAVEALIAFQRSMSVDHLCEARQLLQRSLDIDPNYAR